MCLNGFSSTGLKLCGVNMGTVRVAVLVRGGGGIPRRRSLALPTVDSLFDRCRSATCGEEAGCGVEGAISGRCCCVIPFIAGDGDTFVDELLGCLDLFRPGTPEVTGDLARTLSMGTETPFSLDGRSVRRVGKKSDSLTSVVSEAKLGMRWENDGSKELSPSSSLLGQLQHKSALYVPNAIRQLYSLP